MEKREKLINRLEAEIDRQLDVVVKEFQNLDNQKLLYVTSEGGWSITQNLEHLNFYFEYYNPAIKGAIEANGENVEAVDFKSGLLGGYFTRSMDYRIGGKVKAFKAYIPKEELDPQDVIARFIDNQEELLRLLRVARRYDLTKIMIPISLTKWIKMRLGHVFQFVIMHNERHIVQAQSRL